jgi:hypothetical protein
MSQEQDFDDFPVLEKIHNGTLTTKTALTIVSTQISQIDEEIRLTEMRKHTIDTEIASYEAHLRNFRYPSEEPIQIRDDGVDENDEVSATRKMMEEKIAKEKAVMKWRLERVEEELIVLTAEKERKGREMVAVERFGKKQRRE